jgi:BirA family transcriptional regulator, biotin operon repressor / biotin---[acetyl-CoA-carboxylase] ligase
VTPPAAPSPLISGTVVDEAVSTNDLARVMAEAGAGHGSWISARMQTGGRGRQGNHWISQPGNLYFSYVARVEDRSLWTWIPLAAGVAAARSAERLGGPALRIKWPNDLWLAREDAKAGGILCEAVGTSSGAFVIVGIGLNCAHAPEGMDPPAASLGISVEELRPLLARELTSELADLKGTRARYESKQAFPPGTRITAGNELQAVVLGLGPAGELRVRDESTGKERNLVAEDVRRLRPASR